MAPTPKYAQYRRALPVSILLLACASSNPPEEVPLAAKQPRQTPMCRAQAPELLICNGATCAETDVEIVCGSDVRLSNVAIAPSSGTTAKAFLWLLWGVPGSSDTAADLATVGASAEEFEVVIDPLEKELRRRARVTSDPGGQPALFAATSSGLQYVTRNESEWTSQRVGPVSLNDTQTNLLEAAASDDGRVHVLYRPEYGQLAIGSRDVAGAWSTEGLLEASGFAAFSPLRDTLDVAYWKHEGFDAEQLVTQRLGSEAVPVARATSVQRLSVAPSPEVRPATVAMKESDPSKPTQVFFPKDASFGQVATGGIVTGCPSICAGCSGRCTETVDETWGHAFAVARTADGSVWLARTEQRVERDLQLYEHHILILGCSCRRSTLQERRGALELVLSRLDEATPALEERFRAPLPDTFYRPELRLEARGTQLHVTLAASSLVRRVVLDASKL